MEIYLTSIHIQMYSKYAKKLPGRIKPVSKKAAREFWLISSLSNASAQGASADDLRLQLLRKKQHARTVMTMLM